MRGSAKSPPKYRKHKPSGQAVVTLSGRDIYLGTHGSAASKLEYDRLIGEWLSNNRQLPFSGPQAVVSELVASYWKFAKGYYVKNGQPTDELGCIKVVLGHVRRLYGRSPIVEFGPSALKSVRQVMVDRGNSRKYINDQVKRVRRMFKWGVANEKVPPHIYQALMAVEALKRGKCAAREAAPVLPVADEIVEATLKHCSQTVKDMIQVQRLTGCRPGEVRAMRPIEIDRSHDVWRYTPGSHKMEHTGRARVILIGPKAQAILRPYLLRDASDYCFIRPRGGMYRRWNYNEAINRACDKAFPPPKGTKGEALNAWRKEHRWAPNRLRHSAATEVRRLHGLEAAQTVLGHKSADVTQIYAERDIARAAEIMARVG